MESQHSSFSLSDIPVAILAGGLATRLRPLTETIPKALVPIAGEPFLAHQIRLLRRHGLRKLVLCTGYLGEMIEEQFGDGSEWGVELSYSPDGPKLLGTGGALRRALPLLGDEFFVTYGDSYLEMDYAAAYAIWKQSEKPALMTVFHNQGQFDTSNVWFENGEIVVYDKFHLIPQMEFIDYGLGILRAKVLEAYPPDQVFDLAAVYQELSRNKQLAGYEAKHRFYEIGSHQGISDLTQFLSRSSATN